MRVVVVSREQTDYARTVETFCEDFRRRTGHELERLDPDSPDGVSFCKAYDVLEFPTIIAIDNDGRLMNRWSGAVMPLIDEVNYYVIQN